VASTAGAKVVFQDDFQGQTVGGHAHDGIPQVGEAYYYLGMPHYGTFYDGTTNPPGGGAGERFLGGRTDIAWYGHQNLVITPENETLATNNVVEIKLDAWVGSTSTHWGLNLSTFATVDGGSYRGRAFDLNLKTDGVVSIWDGATSNDVPGGTFRTDTWIPVEIVADYGNGTLQGTVDGFSFSSVFLSAQSEPGNNTLRYFCLDEGGYSPVFVDNVLITIPGIGEDADYNDDGAVDAADYVVSRKGIAPLLNEVAAPIGTTDNQDYAAWRSRFGNPPSGNANSSFEAGSVPEPNSALLFLLAGAAIVGSQRRRSF